MRNRETDDLDALRQALGQPTPPKEIWQRPFDYDPAHLHRLARLEPGQRANAGDLIQYSLDLEYEQVQKDLLLYALPFCLQAWREDLSSENSDYGAFVENFYPALADGPTLATVLTSDEAAAVSGFMRHVILEEIDEQRGLKFKGMENRPYRWVRALTTYGVLLPDLERLWMEWWSRNSLGATTASIQYLSCLVYGERDNPIFAGWTPDLGGGPPCLWEFEGHLYTHCWLAPNVAFLQNTMTVATVTQVLGRAVARLVGYPEHETAARVLVDARERTDLIERRCQELPRILAERQEPGVWREWSE